MEPIPNHLLRLSDIPDPEGDLWGWERFAHSMNGYAQLGSFEDCARLANSGNATSLTELRCALFFEARRDRHGGGTTNEVVIRRLLHAISQKLRDGDLE